MKDSLAILIAIVASPGEAFGIIRERPAWALGLAIAMICAAAGSLIATPAALHMMDISFPAQLASDPRFAGLPPDQLKAKVDQALLLGKKFASFAWIFAAAVVPLYTIIETVVVWAVTAFLKLKVRFVKVLALCTAVQFVALGLGSLVFGIVILLKPLSSIHSQADFLASVPSLAWLAPGAPAKVTAFLSALGPFSIWATILLALGMSAVAGLSPVVAWTVSIAITLLGAAWSTVFIK